MPSLQTSEIRLHYECLGESGNPLLLMIAGLGGAGATWGAQIGRLAERYHVILPDQRGTGGSSRTLAGHTIAQNAADIAALLRHLNIGPAHVLGSSTGGAIAQMLALEHGDLVRTLTMASSFARPDAYLRRQFALRRHLMAHADMQMVYSAYALFLFAPSFARSHPERVQAWVDRAAAAEPDREIALGRIDMVMAHDALERLPAIAQSVLVLCGDCDLCTPLALSQEIADAIPRATLSVLRGGGHFIHAEQEDAFLDHVSAFIERHETRRAA